jgi:hypothetical protein
MRRLPIALFFALFSALPVFARVIVFQEPGFPTVDSEPVSPATLQNALGSDVVFADISALNSPDEFRDAGPPFQSGHGPRSRLTSRPAAICL